MRRWLEIPNITLDKLACEFDVGYCVLSIPRMWLLCVPL